MDTRVSVYKLEVLCKVVERGSVTAAAAALGVAQPVVSAHVRSLERRLGVRLFEREGRGLRLTDAGGVAHAWARDVVERTRHAAAQLDGMRAADAAELGVITSINGTSNGIADATVRFQASHPSARLRLRALPTEHAVSEVLGRRADYAIVSYLAGIAVDGALRVRRLVDDELILVAAPELAQGVDTDALDTLPFVCTPAGTARRRVIDAALAERGVSERRVVMEIGPEQPFHAAIRDGIGYALLSRRSAHAELATGRLVAAELPGGPIAAGIDLVWHRDLEPTPLRHSFRRELAAQLTPAPTV